MLMAHGFNTKRIPASPRTSVRAQAVGSPGLQLVEYSEPPIASELGQSSNKLPLPSASHHFPYRFLSIQTYFTYNFISHIVLYIKFKLTVKVLLFVYIIIITPLHVQGVIFKKCFVRIY